MSSSGDVVTRIIKFGGLTNGRDKFFRLVQYSVKLIWWNLKNKDDFVEKLKKLETSMSMTRKLLRLGKSLDFVQAALKSLHITDDIVRWTVTLSKISQAIFLFFDHIIYFHNLGVIKTDKAKWSKISAQFWFFSLALNLTRNFYDLKNIAELEMSKQEKKESGQQSNGGVSGRARSPGSSVLSVGWQCVCDNKPVFLDLLKNASDLILPLNTLGKVDTSAGVQGFLGIISSTIGVATVWNPNLKLAPS
ncbi:peroxisomal membrane protein 11A-like [Ostrea edulis]|uniref:peroxisomal membrane protein 11A-like n=1 Tax=Ostrea edulis TaxID=37623 RepID=UPI0020956C61|nr:peroxisomal membrane protein 11A-like [Ostrea edulis]